MPGPDTGRFDKLMSPHLPALFRVAYRLVRNVPDAEDLVQDTCIAACENIAALAAAQIPRQWLVRVLYNRFIDGARRRGRSPLVELDDGGIEAFPGDDYSPEQILQAMDGERLLEAAFLSVEESQRTLLVLCAEGYDLDEIDAVVGIGKEALSARIYRARRSLAQQLVRQSDAQMTRRRAGSKP